MKPLLLFLAMVPSLLLAATPPTVLVLDCGAKENPTESIKAGIPGAQVIRVEDYSQALGGVESFKPAVVVMAKMTPSKGSTTGQEAVLEIQKKHKEVPIIFCGNSDEDKAKASLKAQKIKSVHYLQRPYKPEELVSLILQVTAVGGNSALAR